MEMEQKLEWAEAQKIVTSVDLVAAAKQQLKFLAAVDRNRWLYEGPYLERAIYRYNACWLPLLAKYSEAQMTEGPLVVPLDCEWVWHCHRLNPVRYKSDCEVFYGRILDNHNVVSSIQGTSKRETEQIWNKLYPSVPYDFGSTSVSFEKVSGAGKYSQYDLLLAVKRQVPFFYQVSRPHMDNDLFLEAAVARYKGFLHLIKRNRERSLKRFCVPTYDVDLIWHSHQLQPASYCKDLVKILGKVLEHDDTDSDRSKGKKLDSGFSETTKQWEDTFGSRYWRAGAMYRGAAPSPITATPCASKFVTKQVVASNEHQKTVHLPEVKVIEVMLEFVGVRNLPKGHKGSVSVIFSKTQPDTIFSAKRRLTILSESGEKQVASFHCQPTGNLRFELVSHSPSNLKISRPAKTLGSSSISLEDFLTPVSNLSVEKWLELVSSSGTVSSKPIGLRVGLSFTIPTAAPHVLHMVRSRPFSKSSCFFPLPGRVQFTKSWTRVIDETGNEVISLQMRDFSKEKGRNDSILRKEVIGITESGEAHTLAEFEGTEWSLIDSQWSLQLQKISNKDGHLFELTGHRMVKLFPGRKLEYEQHCEEHRSEHDFVTLVEFSAEDPYGRAVALLNLKSGFFKVKEEWLVLLGVTLTFILSDILRKEGYDSLTGGGENLTEMDHKEVDVCHEEDKGANLTTEMEMALNVETINSNVVTPENGMAYSGIGNTVKSGGCGGGCGSGCGSMVKSGGCGGCGSGCGVMVKSGGCGGCGGGGGGCGGGCGNMVKSGGCGSCGGGCGGGGGCGSMVKSGGCGGCGGGSGCGGCGGGCGGMAKSKA